MEDIVEKNLKEGKVFLCPWHGMEIQVFCFRAYKSENSHLWVKASIEIKNENNKS